MCVLQFILIRKSIVKVLAIDVLSMTISFSSGSVKERAVFDEAVKRVTGLKPSVTPRPTLQMNISLDSPPLNGTDIKLKLVLRSDNTKAQDLLLKMSAQVMRYTGTPAADVWSDSTDIRLQPNTGAANNTSNTSNTSVTQYKKTQAKPFKHTHTNKCTPANLLKKSRENKTLYLCYILYFIKKIKPVFRTVLRLIKLNSFNPQILMTVMQK